MVVKVKSNIPYLKNIDGNYQLEQLTTVKNFLESIGVKWDEDALVVINGKISTGEEILSDNDKLDLLIPITGG